MASPAGATGLAAAASVPGVTAKTITLGNVATLSGPVPGLFQGAQAGTDAYFQYINSKGGVDGRKLVLKTADDALTCNQNNAQTKALLNQVFAFVGSFSDFDNCGAVVFDANPGVPDIHYALSTQANQEPNNFSPQPQPAGFRTGPYLYFKQHYPNAIKHVAGLWTSSSPTTWANQSAAMKSVGYKIVYQRSTSPTETNFTSDIIRMRSLGVQYLDLRDQAASTVAQVLNAAAQQNWHPQIISSNSEYESGFFKLLNSPSDANGMITDQQYAMFLGEDSASTPAVRLFLQWMHKTHPSITPDLFAVYGWSSANLFVKALRSAGRNPTRASLLAALRKIHSFNADGMLATANPAAKKPPTCWMLMKAENGKFVRVLPAKKGFTCKPGGYFYAKS